MSIVDAVRYAVSVVLISIGAFFFFVGTLGLLRFPDFYSRTHGATKCDTVGAGSILIGLALLRGLAPDALKILAIAALVLLTSPTAGHALARAAYRTGLRPWTRRIDGGERT
ncbi:monovalent cation/H(+) antiporter subunit G [Coriobacteriia bacterium Es71-Z0120]|uniref:monovalent cation/H(+) antiporter subunit G n=1 Tax=Parvivirga hydrogeniphila TaxID=2939460 RepID=UPI002260B321|nr:monovalent cation/H(+) antiporter subunit G [Parvivirga hydrogeniphila]MCL4078651.1 monovalent cation/H(+) antiporter subunit G [Parvivirga hydrogeniphila]